MNDDQVRTFIARMLAEHGSMLGDPETHQLAAIAQELMLQRDARSEDFYEARRRIAELEARLGSGEVDEDGDAK